MRNVLRSVRPPSLTKNGAKWKTELLAALKSKKRDKKRLERLIGRYRSDDVRTALDTMFQNLCCYCEATVGVVAFEHIEHRRPKAVFPEHAFDWDNLHLGCPRCNQAKADKWDAQNEILDCVVDIPLNAHMTYQPREALGCVRWPLTKRGTTTIEHADLNRRRLCEARTRIMIGVLGVIAEINQASASPAVSVLRSELAQKTNGEYGSLVKWLVDTYLRAA